MSDTKTKILATGVTYVLFAVLTYFTCRHRLMLTESLGTFYHDPDFTAQMLRKPMGLVQWISLLVTQLFAWPIATAMLSALFLTLIAWLTNRAIEYIRGVKTLSPLSLLTPIALCIVQPDIYCQYTYTASMVLMLIALDIVLGIRHDKMRLAVGILMPLLLMHCAGPVSTLYALCLTMIEITIAPRRLSSWLYALTIPIVCLLAYLSVMSGNSSSFLVAITPKGYYTPWFDAPTIVYLPRIVFILVILAVCIAYRVLNKYRRASLIAECAVALAFGTFSYMAYHNAHDELYAELMLYADSQEWEKLSDRYREAGLDSPRLRNLYNLSLAERGQLSKTLFQQHCTGPQTLIDTSAKTPDQYMLLGDIYYSMGHIALARKHTFEANEGFGNLSPRLLKRLVDINLITGDYVLAKKYIDILGSTLLYRDFAADRSRLLYDDAAVAAHPDLGPKKCCIFPDNRFSGSRGIESDLAEILRNNPSNTVAMEYLGMLTLLNRNVPMFAAIADEFYGSALPSPLPKHYQEALAVAQLVSGTTIDPKYQIHPTTVQRCQDFWSKHQDQPGTFWHYLRQSNTINN